MIKKKTFFVRGMHCDACTLLVESEVGELAHVSSVKANLKNESVEVSGEFGKKSSEEIAKELSALLEPHRYAVSMRKETLPKKWAEFVIAIPTAFGILGLFALLQKVGVVHWLHVSGMTYGTAFLIGVIASLSTCMAVVGGLVLSMSATFSKEGEKIRPQLLFHVGRIVSFFVFGGVIGVLGAAFTLTPFAMFFLSMVVGAVMLVLGVNLLDVFPWIKKWQLSMPKRIARRAYAVSKWRYSVAPFFLGGATFFLPCGFTQSMQLFALTTGNFWQGALTLLSFALGTLPVLSILSFGSLSVKPAVSGVFFKVAGIVVIAFGLFNMASGLAVIGVIQPIFNF